MAHSISCWVPQRELVVPNRMSGLTGSSGLWVTAPHTLDGPARLAAAVMPPSASAYETNSRLLTPCGVTLSDMKASFSEVGRRRAPILYVRAKSYRRLSIVGVAG